MEHSPTEYIYFFEIPEFSKCRYTPKPFRSKFEITYWRISTNNTFKIGSYYFTPRVSILVVKGMIFGAE
jgi:hypothetical protein